MAVTQNGNTYISDDESDTFSGSGADDFMYGNEGEDTIKGLGGNDYIQGGVGNDNIEGGEGDDTIFDVGSIPSGFTGLIGIDTIDAGDGNDKVYVGSPDTGDIAKGGSGEDTVLIWFTSKMETPAPIVFSLLQGGSTATLDGINTVFVQGFEKLNFVGNTGNDVITGGALDDSIAGEDGFDTLKGLGGNDTLDGGTGGADMDGGDGIDTVSFDLTGATNAITIDITSGNDINLGVGNGILKKIEQFALIYTGSGNDTIVNNDAGGEFHTNGGNDAFTGGKGDDIWNMGSGNDEGDLGDGSDQARTEGFTFDTGVKNIHGGNGDDYLFGAAGNDQLYGDNDDDFMNGQNGNDQMDGGDGNDDINGGGGDDTLIGGKGNDNLDADHDDYSDQDLAGRDVLNGGEGNDGLTGGVGADQLNGNAGNDWATFYWEDGIDTGADTFDGGDGKDTFSVGWSNLDAEATDEYEIVVRGTSMTAKANGSIVATAINTENLYIQGNAGGTYKMTGDDGVDSIRLGSIARGNDIIKTFGGNDHVESAFGGDTVDSGDGNDYVTMIMGGQDQVTTGDGNDQLILQSVYWEAPELGNVGQYDLGKGKDKLELTAWSNDISFEDGKNIKVGGELVGAVTGWETLLFHASSLATHFVGTDKNETVYFQNADDTAKMGGGNDVIDDGYGGKDTYDGGKGSDTLTYTYRFSQSIEVTLKGSKTAKVTIGGTSEDKIKNIENITGGYVADTIKGDKGDNTLDGLTGDDILDGGAGHDRLIGSLGSDRMTGGAGNDNFVFKFIGSTTAFERDVITDFKRGEDHIDLKGIDPDTTTVKNEAFAFLAKEGAAFDGKGPEVRFDKQSAVTFVELDANGDKLADWHFELSGVVGLTKADFLL